NCGSMLKIAFEELGGDQQKKLGELAGPHGRTLLGQVLTSLVNFAHGKFHASSDECKEIVCAMDSAFGKESFRDLLSQYVADVKSDSEDYNEKTKAGIVNLLKSIDEDAPNGSCGHGRIIHSPSVFN